MCLYIFTHIYIYIYIRIHIYILYFPGLLSSSDLRAVDYLHCQHWQVWICAYKYIYSYAHIYIHLQVKFLMYSAALCHICNLSPYICAVDFRQCQLMQSTLSTADVVSVGYVCIHTCMYVYMYIHVCMYTYTYMYVYTHIYIHTCMHAYRVCTYVHVNLRQWQRMQCWGCVHMYIYIYAWCVHMYMYIYAYAFKGMRVSKFPMYPAILFIQYTTELYIRIPTPYIGPQKDRRFFFGSYSQNKLKIIRIATPYIRAVNYLQCQYLRVWGFVCVYMYMYICLYTHLLTWVCVCMYACVCVCGCGCVCGIYTYLCMCVYVHVHVCVCVCVCLCMSACAHMYKHTYVFKSTGMYMSSSSSLSSYSGVSSRIVL